MCAVSWASCAWKWDNWRALVAEVGTVDSRVCVALGVRAVVFDIFALIDT